MPRFCRAPPRPRFVVVSLGLFSGAVWGLFGDCLGPALSVAAVNVLPLFPVNRGRGKILA